jgi:hypothetical protein
MHCFWHIWLQYLASVSGGERRFPPDGGVCRDSHHTAFAFSGSSLWNDRFHALLHGLLNDRIAVIATICNQAFGSNPFHQAASLRAIRCGTLCNKDSDRHTMRIHGQMYLGVEPPFVRPMS